MTDTRGRPVERGPIKRVTLEIPEEDWNYISSISSNRTQWIIKAIKIVREQEEREKARFHGHTMEEIQTIQQKEKRV